MNHHLGSITAHTTLCGVPWSPGFSLTDVSMVDDVESLAYLCPTCKAVYQPAESVSYDVSREALLEAFSLVPLTDMQKKYFTAIGAKLYAKGVANGMKAALHLEKR